MLYKSRFSRGNYVKQLVRWKLINRFFFPCSPSFFRSIGQESFQRCSTNSRAHTIRPWITGHRRLANETLFGKQNVWMISPVNSTNKRRDKRARSAYVINFHLGGVALVTFVRGKPFSSPQVTIKITGQKDPVSSGSKRSSTRRWK